MGSNLVVRVLDVDLDLSQVHRSVHSHEPLGEVRVPLLVLLAVVPGQVVGVTELSLLIVEVLPHDLHQMVNLVLVGHADGPGHPPPEGGQGPVDRLEGQDEPRTSKLGQGVHKGEGGKQGKGDPDQFLLRKPAPS